MLVITLEMMACRGIVFTALDCQQPVWTSICTEWCWVFAAESNQYWLHPPRRALHLWYILGKLRTGSTDD